MRVYDRYILLSLFLQLASPFIREGFFKHKDKRSHKPASIPKKD
jgi:hypothetical protein